MSLKFRIEGEGSASCAPELSWRSDLLDRRTLMATVGSAAIAGLGMAVPGSAQVATRSTHPFKRIDAHTHFVALKYLDFAEQNEGRPFVLSGMYRNRLPIHDGTARLALLDRNQIDLHALVPLPWLDAFPRVANDRALAIEAAKIVNNEIAAVVAAQPRRFRGVALLPTAHPDAMIAELTRAVRELGFVGGYVPVGPTVKRMDHPDYETLFKCIVELDATLWLHPSRPPMPEYSDETASHYQEWEQIGWPHDTTSAMYRIVFSGVFDRYPGIRIVVHHYGGFLPFFAQRMTATWAGFEEAGMGFQAKISKPYIDHFKKFHCDTAVSGYGPKVLDLAVDFFGPDRVLFGSDAPFGVADGQSYITDTLRSIEDMSISGEVRSRILTENAIRILKI
jgi:predicted TIM-barrel fold metal-dependent hydrolase